MLFLPALVGHITALPLIYIMLKQENTLIIFLEVCSNQVINLVDLDKWSFCMSICLIC